MKGYKLFGLLCSMVFAAVGILFLFIPNEVLRFFNHISGDFNLPQSPLSGDNFYLILAVGYMYLVTVIAYLIYRHPENKVFPMLLANAKLFSSLLSLYLILSGNPYLIYITNCLTDGFIGFIALVFYFRIRKMNE